MIVKFILFVLSFTFCRPSGESLVKSLLDGIEALKGDYRNFGEFIIVQVL